MSDDLRERLIDHIANMELPRAILSNDVVKILADDQADALLPFIRAEIADTVKVERFKYRERALPDRWLSLRAVDLIGLLEIYREHREGRNEDHDDALGRVLTEVDFEPNADDIFEWRHRDPS